MFLSVLFLSSIFSLLNGCTCLNQAGNKKLIPAEEIANINEKNQNQGVRSIMKTDNEFNLEKGQKLYATFKTSMGDMVAELYWEKAPKTVANFVGLAEGSKPWVNPKTGKKETKPLYSGTIFHRVIPDFMIQGGDPLGVGMGGPGYNFADEFDPTLRHNAPGILSMANSGPGTNGSQFFITETATPHLDDRHSVFGKIIENSALIAKIARVPRGRNDKPSTDVVLNEVVITRK